MRGGAILTFEFVWSVLTFAFGVAGTPGPNTAVAFSTGLNYGFLSVVPYMFGVSLGVPSIIAAVGWGLGEFFSAYPEVYDYVRCAGIAYIFYLAWKIAAAPVQDDNAKTTSVRRPTFLNGILFQCVNPKVWMLAFTSVATYVGRNFSSARLLFLCGAFSLVCPLCLLAWSLGGKLSGRLVRSSRAHRSMNLFMGLLLASSVLTLF